MNMGIRTKINFVLVLTALMCIAAGAQDRVPSPGDYADSIADAYLKKSGGTAFVIGLYDMGKEEIRYYGRTGKLSASKPDENSIFELGNITETFTSVLLAHMSIKGQVSIEDPTQKFMPAGVNIPVFQNVVCEPVRVSPSGPGGDIGREIKFTPYVCYPDPKDRPRQLLLCDLATHTTGLPDVPYNLPRKTKEKDSYSLYTTKHLHDYLNGLSTINPAGFVYRHSSVGTVILGHALSEKTKKPFDSLLTKTILEKLHMNSTGYIAAMQKDTVRGYTTRGKETAANRYTVWAPASGLYSTPGDLMKFLKANLGFCEKEMKDALDYTHNARLLVQNPKSPFSEVGLNWYITTMGDGGKKITWNASQTDGFSAYVGFLETEKKGVFILTNCPLEITQAGLWLLNKLDQTGKRNSTQ